MVRIDAEAWVELEFDRKGEAVMVVRVRGMTTVAEAAVHLRRRLKNPAKPPGQVIETTVERRPLRR